VAMVILFLSSTTVLKVQLKIAVAIIAKSNSLAVIAFITAVASRTTSVLMIDVLTVLTRQPTQVSRI
jgi:hypothetical protein